MSNDYASGDGMTPHSLAGVCGILCHLSIFFTYRTQLGNEGTSDPR